MAGTPCFDIALIEGKGVVASALRNIQRGERILIEKQAFAVSFTNCEGNEEQFEVLSESKQLGASLHDARSSRNEKTFRGILNTNALGRGSDANICA